MPEFYMIFAQKINKMPEFPEFYMTYARKKLTKCPNFTRFCPKKSSFRPNFGGGGGATAPLPPSPTPMLLRVTRELDCVLDFTHLWNNAQKQRQAHGRRQGISRGSHDPQFSNEIFYQRQKFIELC